MRNWSVCTPSTFTRRTASELVTVRRPKPLLPSSGLFQESSILHILDTQRVCSVSLTTDSANFCSLLQEYHRAFFTFDVFVNAVVPVLDLDETGATFRKFKVMPACDETRLKAVVERTRYPVGRSRWTRLATTIARSQLLSRRVRLAGRT